MASKIEFSNWVIKNFQEGKIKITQLSWPEELNLPFFDFQVSLPHGSNTFIGRATDSNRQIAIEKAASEALEKYLLSELNLTNTNGLALHPDKMAAQSNAANEAIERDLFLSYFYTDEPFYECDSTSAILQDLKRITLRFGWQTRFFILNAKDNIYTVMCAIEGSGIILGLSTKVSNLEEALLHATLEAMRNWVHDIYFNNIAKKVIPVYEDFLSKPDPETHGDYYLSESNYLKIKNKFSTLTATKPQKEYPKIDVTKIDLEKFELTKDLNLHCYRAYAPHIQNLFFGLPSQTTLNIERLKQFSNKPNLTLNMLSIYPHPFR